MFVFNAILEKLVKHIKLFIIIIQKKMKSAVPVLGII